MVFIGGRFLHMGGVVVRERQKARCFCFLWNRKIACVKSCNCISYLHRHFSFLRGLIFTTNDFLLFNCRWLFSEPFEVVGLLI